MQMKINTLGANKAIYDAITAINDSCTYGELRTNTIKLISALSYLVGCVEGIQGEADDE